MLQTYKSNSLTILAHHLAGELAQRAPDDPFVPVEVIVPNLDTSRWLKLILSEQSGIVANCRFILPAEWQFRQIRKKYKQLPSVLPSDPAPLTWALFDLLMDDEQRSRFSRLDRYISVQPAEMKEQAAMQLAGKIASVFDQYIVYRPELITGWQRGEVSADPDEQWQAKLWNTLESVRKKRERGTGYPNKAELILEVSDELRNGTVEHEQPVYLFNPGLMPVPVIQMVKNLSDHTDVLVYRVTVQKNKSGNENRNPLMQAYGEESAGSDALYSFTNGEETGLFTELSNEPESLLQQVQKSLLMDELIGRWEEKETGIEIHSCHTPLREIEVLHQSLLRRFEKDPNLHPDDVLVVTPDLDTYKPFIHAVFGTDQEGTPRIPYHAGFDGGADSGIKRVLLHLLEIVDSRYTFSEVLDLFMEDAVRERFSVSESGADRNKRWMEENNVIWGLDKEHRRESGQPESDLQTWQSAMQRGWKGMLMGSSDDPFESDMLHYDEIQGRDREEDWSSFSAFLNRLKEIGSEAKREHTVSGWCDFVEKMMNSVCSAESLKGREADQIRRAIEKSREATAVARSDRKITWSLFRSQIRNLLQLDSASTAIFTRGVAFSSMVPVRSIPAKIIALVGLNESDFPRKPKSADFDLMAKNPEPTDRNRKNEDRNLFLESIMAAGSLHYCSYIGRSRVDNEPIPPSPIVSEWINRVAEAVGKKPKEIVIQEPLHGFSAENFRLNRSYARTEYLTANMIRKNRGEGTGLNIGNPLPDPENMNRISVEQLVRFYSNPLSYFFKSRFNPQVNSPDELKKEFTLNGLERHKLFEMVFGWRLAEKSEEQILNLLYKTGSVPAGWQGEMILRDIVLNVDRAIELARDHGFEPEMTDVDLTIILADLEIGGSLLSYSADRFLDITTSSFSGSKVFRSWLRHLCATASGEFPEKESHFLCDLKKEKPLWVTFKPFDDAEVELEKLVEIYRKGNLEPQMLFPSTAYSFQKEIYRGKEDPEGKAAAAFEGTDYAPFSENRDLFLSLIEGPEPEFERRFIDPDFQPLIENMLNYMDPVK